MLRNLRGNRKLCYSTEQASELKSLTKGPIIFKIACRHIWTTLQDKENVFLDKKILLWWFGLKLEPMFDNASVASKMILAVKVIKSDSKVITLLH